MVTGTIFTGQPPLQSNVDVNYPDRSTVDDLLPEVTYPDFYELRQNPATSPVEDVRKRARQAVDSLSLDDLTADATIGVGLGSRGITDVVSAARGVVDELQSRGYDVVVLPAMGSHGGASAEGQRDTLAALGLTEETLGCPIDARMETAVLGTSEAGNDVHFAESALDVDAVCVINRVKPHTNFSGTFESGLTKMTCIGLGKQPGAKTIHQRSIGDGYEETLRASFETIRESVTLLGGVAVVENFYEDTAEITGIQAADLPDAEEPLLDRAYDHMPTLPFDEIDVLVVDEIGKDISGAGMDPNITGRYRLLNVDDPDRPDIKRIYVRGLTEATHGNAIGLGVADLTLVDVIANVDLDQVYANALTSGSLDKAALPLAVRTDELAFRTAVSTIGAWKPESVRLVWIRNTNHLSEMEVSPALAAEARDRAGLSVGDRCRLEFERGEAVLRPH